VGPALQSGDPVNLETGAFTYSAQLVAGTNPVQPFRFEIFYDSSSKSTGGAVGRKWSHTYELRIEGIGTARLKVVRGDGAADYFDARTVNGVTDWYATYPQTRTRLDFFAGAFIYSDTEQMQYTFDAQGRLSSLQGRSDAIGQTSGFKYGGNGRLASVTGPAPALALATFSYDANKRLTDIYYDDGYQHVTLTYDAAGNLTSFSSPTNPALRTRFTYDADGNLLTGTTGTGPADDVRFVSNTYASGEVVSQTDAYGGVTRFEYSVNQTKVTDPNGSVSTRTFDEAGRITGAVTPDGATFSWFYDAKGNLAQVNGPRGSRTMTYDAKFPFAS
jgi:YD repeat-containing protein